MSWKATGWAKESTGHKSAGEKFLLLVLADYAEPERCECWPSIQKLAADCMVSRRTIMRNLDDLEQRGYITRLNKGNQYVTSLYRVNVGFDGGESECDKLALSPDEGDTGVTCTSEVKVTSDASESDKSASEGDKFASESDKSASEGDTAMSPKPSIEPSEPSLRTVIEPIWAQAPKNQNGTANQSFTETSTLEAPEPEAVSAPPSPPPQNPTTPSSPRTLSSDFVGRMRERYPALDVEAELESALNHVAVKKAIDVEMYAANWLRRADQWVKERPKPSARSPAKRPEIEADWEKYSYFGDEGGTP